VAGAGWLKPGIERRKGKRKTKREVKEAVLSDTSSAKER
jgi:hypothetical protein